LFELGADLGERAFDHVSIGLGFRLDIGRSCVLPCYRLGERLTFFELSKKLRNFEKGSHPATGGQFGGWGGALRRSKEALRVKGHRTGSERRRSLFRSGFCQFLKLCLELVCVCFVFGPELIQLFLIGPPKFSNFSGGHGTSAFQNPIGQLSGWDAFDWFSSAR